MHKFRKVAIDSGFEDSDVSDEAVVCDSSFWQALRKAYQWDDFDLEIHHKNFFSETLHADWKTAVKYLKDVTAHKNI